MIKIYSSKIKLNTPVSLKKLNNKYFIVNCWDNSIIYLDDLSKDLNEWSEILNFSSPHEIILIGETYYVCNTDNNEILSLNSKFKNTGKTKFEMTRPHYICEYNGGLLVLDWHDSTSRLIYFDLELNFIDVLFKINNDYCRSFSFVDGQLIICGSSSGTIYVLNDQLQVRSKIQIRDSNVNHFWFDAHQNGGAMYQINLHPIILNII